MSLCIANFNKQDSAVHVTEQANMGTCSSSDVFKLTASTHPTDLVSKLWLVKITVP